MQKISRKDLGEIYPKVCSGWQTKIEEHLSRFKFSDNIEVEDSLIQEAYSEGDKDKKTLIKKYFNLPKDITDQVKTFDDILRLSGEAYDDVIPWRNPKTKEQKSQNAFAKIQLITKVYNQGVELDWSNKNQYKYYPYFEKKTSGGWGLGGVGVCCCAFGGFGDYFKTRELCEDAVNKFLDIYIEYLPN